MMLAGFIKATSATHANFEIGDETYLVSKLLARYDELGRVGRGITELYPSQSGTGAHREGATYRSRGSYWAAEGRGAR